MSEYKAIATVHAHGQGATIIYTDGTREQIKF